jgi:rhamnogalacturonyl hydrolase YesR
LQKDEHYKEVIIQASKTLIKRYNPAVGAIKSWDWSGDKWQFPVIIDNMMNLEMLFDATDFTGDSSYYKVAYTHAKTTLKNHYRSDMSSYHVIDYDTLTGMIRNRHTHQGFSHESAWSRGQAWGLYGFAHAYSRTGDKAFLEGAIKIADYFFNHPNMPKDLIPYWDFDAPNIPNEPRDVSAATVAASALLQLMKFDTANKDKYMAWVDRIITSLEYPQYQSNVTPFLLSQSTGSIPGNFEVNVPIIYGDYYYVETLLKRLTYF